MYEGNRHGQTARLWISWLVVSALLGYGVVQTLITAAKLFIN
ncbi:MFS transporter small subunit [Micromonospora sp. DT47]